MTEKQIITLISQIEDINLKSDDAFQEIDAILRGKLNQIAIFGYDLEPHPDLFFIRARILENTTSIYETVHDHSYNPNKKDIKIGRANKPNQQVFYLGRTRPTSLGEVNIIQNKQEEEIVSYSLSRWQSSNKMKIAAILDPDKIDKLKCEELDGFLIYVKETYSRLQDSENSGILKLYKYISEKFSELIVEGEEYKYKITSAFSNLIYDLHPGIAGLMYQSVRLPESYNLAIKKEYIDNKYFKPTHFVKNTFKRKNIIELSEIERQTATRFDLNLDLVEWNLAPIKIQTN